MILDNIFYIGYYLLKILDIYVEIGFKKWGMIILMVVVMIISDMIFGKENDFLEIFLFGRFDMLVLMKNVVNDLMIIVKNFIV